MSEREEVLNEFTDGDPVDGHVGYLDVNRMADEIATLREQLAEVTEAFTVHLNAHNEEVPALRSQLDAVTNQCAIWEEEADRFMKAHVNEIRKRTAAERERDEARRELKALKERDALVMKCPVCDDRKAHAHCVHELRHRAERMAAVVEAAKVLTAMVKTTEWKRNLGYDCDVTMKTYNGFECHNALTDFLAAVRALTAAEGA